jgi:hypothetical protein
VHKINSCGILDHWFQINPFIQEIMMKKMFIGVSALTLALLSGCATTDAPPTAKKADAQLAGFSATTGSRIPRATTDRVVKSTERDLADEQPKTIGNLVGQKGN